MPDITDIDDCGRGGSFRSLKRCNKVTVKWLGNKCADDNSESEFIPVIMLQPFATESEMEAAKPALEAQWQAEHDENEKSGANEEKEENAWLTTLKAQGYTVDHGPTLFSKQV